MKLLRDSVSASDSRITGFTLAALLAAVLVHTYASAYIPYVFVGAAVVMVVNLLAAVFTYYREELGGVFSPPRFNPFTQILAGTAIVTCFTAAMYVAPILSVAVLGFLAGMASIAFIDTVARNITAVTRYVDLNQLTQPLLATSILVATAAAAAGYAVLGQVPGFGEGLFVGGVTALVFILFVAAAVTVKEPGTVVHGVELLEMGVYLVWFLPVSAGYVAYAVAVDASFASASPFPFAAAAAIFLIVFTVFAAVLKRFETASLPMVNPENIGYVFLYFLSALTVIWAATSVYTVTVPDIVRVFRLSLIIGAGVGVPHALYKKYWLLQNRDPWYRTTVKLQRNGGY